MKTLNSSLIENYLKIYGWDFYKISHNIVISGWQSQKRLYPLFIELSNTIINLEIRPFIKLNKPKINTYSLLEYLLKINNDIKIVKLAINDNEEIILNLQLFTLGLSYENFCNALGILGYYADELYENITQYQDTLNIYNKTESYLLPC